MKRLISLLGFIGLAAFALPAEAQVSTCRANAAAPTYVEGQAQPCSIDLSGNIRITGTFSLGANQSVNLNQVSGAAVAQGHGTAATALRVELPTDGTGVVGLNAGTALVGKVGIDQTTPGTTNGVQVNAALPAGANVIGHVITDTTSTTAVTGNVTVVQPTGTNLHAVLDTTSTTAVTQATAANLNATVVLAAGSALAGKVGIDQTTPGTTNGVSATNFPATVATGTGAQGATVPRVTVATDTATVAGSATLPAGTNTIGNVVLVPSASAGGTTLFTLTLAASTNATNVKASAGQLYSISGFNMSSATPVWISLYNNSGTPTCGTAIIQQFLIPGSTTGTGFVYDFAAPKGFATGIAFCATTGIAGTGNPAATTYVLNIDYK